MSKAYTFTSGIKTMLKSFGFWLAVISIALSFYAGKTVSPTWTAERVTLDVKTDATGGLYYIFKGDPVYLADVVSIEQSVLGPESLKRINAQNDVPSVEQEYVYERVSENGTETTYYHLYTLQRHWGPWSLLPALVAIVLCWVIKEPIIALVGGIVSGSFILGAYNITEQIFIPKFATTDTAGVLFLYLLLLGGLLGVWSRTGAAKAFADMMTKYFVRGPRTAKLVSWILGVIFHQGGTLSTVLVGTTVKPIADKERVSHEELSYIVDSTASPVAALIPFNAWPGYVQAFIYVAGISWLATETDRILFFFSSIPLSFYCILAVFFTFLFSLEKMPFMGKKMRAAIVRARTTGELDAPDAEPLSSKDLLDSHNIPEGYTPHVSEFFIPILVLMSVTVGTFIFLDSPQVRWGFALGLVVAIFMAAFRGMKIKTIILGLEDGLKGVVVGAVILLLAITIGSVSSDVGAGIYMVELLGSQIPFWLLPLILQVLTMIISFSTGTSWGTYAVAFPLAMPLAFAVAASNDVSNVYLYSLICFSTVLNGSVFGDQCSPISDTTVLSALVTGCDLMDHVKTQLFQASIAAAIAAAGWTLLSFVAA